MKVTMLELVQGSGVSGVLLHEGLTVAVLEKDEQYEVSAALGAWLLEHRKAKSLELKQPEPPVNHDEILAELSEGLGEYEPLPELTEENAAEEKTAEPIMTTEQSVTTPKFEKPRRGKRGAK